MSDKKMIIVSLVLLVLVGAAAYFFEIKKQPASQMAALRAKTEKFINDNLVPPGTNAKIKDMVEENGLYKITVTVGNQDLPAYISKDGKDFFPQVFSMEPTTTPTPSGSDASVQPASQPATQQAVPDVELFVMSYCPYGLQMEKGILPAIEALGSKINFSLKFVAYAMHGDQEIQENLRQYCVQQQGFEKFDNYLKCFTDKSDSTACLSSAKIDTTKLASCVSATDAQFNITANAKDQSQWKGGQYPPFGIYQADNDKYGVSSSPTLVINGTTVSANRDPQSLLNLICSGFSNQPSACSQKLSTTEPAAGFGSGSATNSGTASSNSSCATSPAPTN
jgi:glutaredoxin